MRTDRQNILVLNIGSSSIKYRIFDMCTALWVHSGVISKLGEANCQWCQQMSQGDRTHKTTQSLPCLNLHKAVIRIAESIKSSSALFGIGHRVVHGGERFSAPTLIDDNVLNEIDALSCLAPLHNPANKTGIVICKKIFEGVPQVAVFDTAFHQSMPDYVYRYALPEHYYTQYHVRRYGFHGTSHQNVARQAAQHLDRPLPDLNLISLHLGNGASAAAIRKGKSLDTSMGMTPLEGLIMGTRCGDLDPAIPFYLAAETNTAYSEIERVLNEHSGLKGLCGEQDIRAVHRNAQQQDKNAHLALEMLSYRIKKYIGAYFAILGEVDAIVFTAGIGEHDAKIREKVCSGLESLGIALDSHRNDNVAEGIVEINQKDARIKLLVIPTREEWEIANQTLACIQAARA